MLNIMKAINYQCRRDLEIVIACIVFFALLFAVVMMDANISDMTGGMYMVTMGEMLPMLLLVFAMVMVPTVVGKDMNDKTMNYEVMSGHSRKEVYFARVISAYLWSGLSMVFMLAVPFLLFTVINGWGDSVIFVEFIERYAVVLLVYIRIVAELILLTFLVRNGIAATAVAYVLIIPQILFSLIVEEMFDFLNVGLCNLDAIFSAPNIMAVTEVINSRDLVVNGETIRVYETLLSNDLLVSSIVMSVLMTAICLAAGYVVFKKRDMK